MTNPFFYGGRVEPDLFIGRQKELRLIFNCIETTHTEQLQSISLVGPHRTGRSSLLCYVVAKYAQYLKTPSNYRFAYISLHDAECHTPSGLLHKILQELRIRTAAGKNTSLAEFQKSLNLLKCQKICPVVCLDEFEELIQTGSFNNEFFDSWRHLMSNSLIAFVIASTRSLNELIMCDKYTSSFFNIFTIIELGEFTETEAKQLVERGRSSDQPFNNEDCRLMRTLGGQHPYKLQVAGNKIYFAKINGGKVNWEQVKHDVEIQLRQAGLVQKSLNWPTVISQIVLAFFKSVGRAILVVRRGKEEISNDVALLWGLCFIIVVVLFAMGYFQLSWLTKAVSHWLGK